MTISIHPARRPSEDVPPGTWEGTKQDAVLATAQLQEIWERKKRGEIVRFGHNEYDAQMANAQLRAFKLTKAILRSARRNSASDINKKIEEMGFVVDTPSAAPDEIHPPLPGPPPIAPLPMPPMMRKQRSKVFRDSTTFSSPTPHQITKAASAPASPLRPPPIVPRKSMTRQTSPPRSAPGRFSRRQPSVEFPQPNTYPAGRRSSRVPSPSLPSSVIPARRDSSTPPLPQRGSPVAEKDTLPVLPFRRKPVANHKPTSSDHEITPRRSATPLPPPPSPYLSSPRLSPAPPPSSPTNEDPPLPPARSPYRNSVYGSRTQPLIPKRRSLQRSISFRFGESLQYSVSKSLYSELSSALDDLQRSLGGATVEVH